MGLLHSPLSPTDGLVLCLDSANRRSYPGSGNTWFDLSGNNNHGTLTNGASYNGFAMNFDGVDDRIAISNTTAYGFVGNSSRFSVSFWWNKPTEITASGRFIIAKGTGASANGGWFINMNWDGNGVLPNYLTTSLYSGSSAYLFHQTTYTTGQWNHGTYVYDLTLNGNARIKCFINGLEITGSYITQNFTGIASNTNPLTIGNATTNNLPALGPLDDIRIYNRALSEVEIGILFNSKRMRYGL